MAGVATLPPAAVALGILAIGMGCLGMGNGSVFQLLPQRFPDSVGVLTGIVGAAGGLGGFFLPSALGYLKDKTGSFGSGFALLAVLAACGTVTLLALRPQWRRTWPAVAAYRAGVFPKGYAAGA